MSADCRPINIYCASCGAPAQFDIARQIYTCRYCGAETGIREALAEKQGFRRLHRQSMEQEKRNYPLAACACTGCGAEVVFPENEALTQCAFCGRALARREYLGVEGFPEVLIPFKLTQTDAKARLLDWCRHNRFKREARTLRKQADELAGFYLPYELIRGPLSCEVSRDDTGRSYECRSFLEGSFINTSKQLDNLLLDAAEPYELGELREFSFSWLAGQRVKMRDLGDAETAQRVSAEIAADYTPFAAKAMETKAVRVRPATGALLELGAVLPAYYLRAGKTAAAVNGQTGKVAVREIRRHYMLPWWLRPIGWTILLAAVIFGAMYVFGAELMACMFVTGLMTAFLLTVLFVAYHDKYGGDGRVELPRRVFTSDKRRPTVAPAEFYATVDGQARPASVRFTTPLRVARMLGIALGTVFLPLILAFLLNGCSPRGLHIGGAGVWLCITVPVAPVYLLKFGRLELYEHPLLRFKTPEGKWKRLGKKRSWKEHLRALRVLRSPGILAIAAGALLLLAINVYLILHWD